MVAVAISGLVVAGSEADLALDPLEVVAGEREVRLLPVEDQVEEQALLALQVLEQPDEVVLLGERDEDVLVVSSRQMTSVFPAAATSRSRYLPPPTAPSDMPLSQSTSDTPRAPSMFMASFKAASIFMYCPLLLTLAWCALPR